jgi:hypothetical protein
MRGPAVGVELHEQIVGTIDYSEARGSVVVEALCYKPEGRGFDFRRGH